MANKLLLILLIALLSSLIVKSQVHLKKVMALKIPGYTTGYAGSLVWHPVEKYFYSILFGNNNTTIVVFDKKGKSIATEISMHKDYKGIWYNTSVKRIEFICLENGGFGYFKTNPSGKISDTSTGAITKDQLNQLNSGTYMQNGNKIIFYDKFALVQYDAKTFTVSGNKIPLYLGCSAKAQFDLLSEQEKVDMENARNKTQVLYTQRKGAEFSLLNINDRLLEMYDANTGLLSKTVPILSNTAVYPVQNFSYTNNTWWFFNQELGTWFGYR